MNEKELTDSGDCETDTQIVNDIIQTISICVAAGSAVVLFYFILRPGLVWLLGSSIAAILAGHYAKRKVRIKSLSVPKSVIAFSLIAGYASLGITLTAILIAGGSMVLW